MPGLRRPAQPRNVHKGGQPHILAPAQRQQSLGHEGTVEALERNHVRDGAERHQIEEAEQIGFAARRRPEAARPQLPVHRHHHHEGEADSRQIAELRKIIEPVGIDHRKRRRQRFVGLMMIDDDGGETQSQGFRQRLVAGGAAIDGDQERGARGMERADRLDIGAVAFEHPIRNMNDRIEAAMAQEPRQHRRRAGAVNIIVAENRDLLAARDSLGQARGGRRHVGEHARIGHQQPHGRVEKTDRLLHLDPAARQDAGQQFRQFVPLHDGERPCRAALVEAVAPGAAGRGLLDPEEVAIRGDDIHARDMSGDGRCRRA